MDENDSTPATVTVTVHQLAIILHDRECPDRCCTATVMGKYYNEARQILKRLQGQFD